MKTRRVRFVSWVPLKNRTYSASDTSFARAKTDERLELLARHRADRIEELDLSRARLTSRSLQYLPRFDRLRRLDLSGTALKSSGAQYLAHLKGLRQLNVSGTDMGSSSASTSRT